MTNTYSVSSLTIGLLGLVLDIYFLDSVNSIFFPYSEVGS